MNPHQCACADHDCPNPTRTYLDDLCAWCYHNDHTTDTHKATTP